MTNLPHDALNYSRPDEVAECWDGVDDALYAALWDAMSHAKPLSEHIDIEESAPDDALGLESVADHWNRFTPEQQAQLNAVAERNA